MMPAIASILPGAADERLRGDHELARRHPLQDGVDGREQHATARSRPLTRASRASAIMRCATTAACGDTRS